MRKFTREEIARHCSEDDVWIVIGRKVYDVTAFLYDHPGGDDVILDVAGKDATSAFESILHSKEAMATLEQFYIGEVG